MRKSGDGKNPFVIALGVLVVAVAGLVILADINKINESSYAAPVFEEDVKIANITTFREETTVLDEKITGPTIEEDTNLVFSVELAPEETYAFTADIFNNTKTNTTLENHDFIITKDDLVTSDIDYALTLDGYTLASVNNSAPQYIVSVIEGNSKKELKGVVRNTSSETAVYNFVLEMEFQNK